MLIDYRVYGTIYTLCVLGYVAALPMIHLRGGRYFWPIIGSAIAVATITSCVNFLDWLWS